MILFKKKKLIYINANYDFDRKTFMKLLYDMKKKLTDTISCNTINADELSPSVFARYAFRRYFIHIGHVFYF